MSYHSCLDGATRRGAALIIVVVALAVLGALAAGVFTVAWRENRSSQNFIERVRALGAAEHGVYTAVAPDRWHADWNAMRPLALLSSTSERLGDGASVDTHVWKLTPWSALAVSDGSASAGAALARRRVALLLAMRAPAVWRGAAIVTRQGVALRDGSSVSGIDASASDDCPPTDSTVAAIAVPTDATVDTAACPPTHCLTGSPPVAITSRAASPDTYEQFGQVDRSFLVNSAVSLADGTTMSPQPVLNEMGDCDGDAPGNLGDPLRVFGPESPCASRFTLRHADGDLHISGGAGQGMLLVDGDLTLANGALFTGIVIARGAVRLEDASRLDGMVLATRVALSGTSAIRYSSCAVNRSLVAGARPIPALGQSWTEMF